MTFRDALVRFAPQFSGRDQQDSQEFLMFLLDGLHEDMNQYASQSRVIRISSSSKSYSEEDHERLPDWQASAMSWDKYLAKNTSIIVDLFQGQYQSRLTCLSCKQVNHYNNFISKSLTLYIDFYDLQRFHVIVIANSCKKTKTIQCDTKSMLGSVY